MSLLLLLNGGTEPTTLRLELGGAYTTQGRLLKEADGAYTTQGRLLLDVEGAYTVQGRLLLALGGAYSQTQTLTLALGGAYSVKESDPMRLALGGAYTTQGRLRALVEGAYSVARRSHIVPGDPPVEVIDDMTAFFQVGGVTLTPIGPFEPGGESPTWDEIRHYDGSLLVHDVREGLYDMSAPIMVTAASPSALKTAEDAIRTACRAGGTAYWQSVGPGGEVGPMEEYTFAPSAAPSFKRDKSREALLRSYATVTLHVFPSS